jgi:orotate phosphoribosyltransferase
VESNLSELREQFIRFALDSGVLMFGEFTTKAGRSSPYFFNAGLFNRGATLATLARFYAKTLVLAEQTRGLKLDMLFGPAYKGITLAAATAIAMAELPAGQGGRDLPFSYNRKEAKDHGEGGTIVGAKLSGNVVIIDDVISAGTSVRESLALIHAAGATPAAVLIALDRMERGGNAQEVSQYSAVQEVEQQLGIPVISIATLADVMSYLSGEHAHELSRYAPEVAAYRARYGVADMRTSQ